MHPVLVDFGVFAIPSYGALVAAGYLTGIFWLKANIRYMNLSEDGFWDLIYYLFFGAIAGGKILYILVEYRQFLSGQLGFFRDFRYGFVFFGGVLGSLAMGLFARRRLKFDIWAVYDYFATALPLGHAIGRLGCLASGCCYGRPTGMPWGLSLGGHPASTTPHELWGIPLHPTQIYEALGNVGIFLFLRFGLLPRIQKKELVTGTACLAYAVLYFLLRFLVENFRGDDRGMLAGLATSQWLALTGLAIAGFFIHKRGIYARN